MLILQSGIQKVESRIKLGICEVMESGTYTIWYLASKMWNLESGYTIWYLASKMWNLESAIRNQETKMRIPRFEIQKVEAKIQDLETYMVE